MIKSRAVWTVVCLWRPAAEGRMFHITRGAQGQWKCFSHQGEKVFFFFLHYHNPFQTLKPYLSLPWLSVKVCTPRYSISFFVLTLTWHSYKLAGRKTLYHNCLCAMFAIIWLQKFNKKHFYVDKKACHAKFCCIQYSGFLLFQNRRKQSNSKVPQVVGHCCGIELLVSCLK